MSKGYLKAGTDDNDDRYSYDQAKQKRWMEFSAETIDFAVERIKNNPMPSFRELYKKLAQRRAIIAEELGHGRENPAADRLQEYGQFRTFEYNKVEEFFADESMHLWPKQERTVREKVAELVADVNFMKFDVTSIKDFQKAVLIPNNAHDKTPKLLPRIIYSEKDGEIENIKIFYTDLSARDVANIWGTLDKYFHDILESDEKDLAANSAKLMHLLGNFLPCDLGSAAIGEWMIRSAAEAKGCTVKFDFKEGGNIGWDFNALVTPDIEKYTEWFVNKAVTFTRIKPSEEVENPIMLAAGQITPEIGCVVS